VVRRSRDGAQGEQADAKADQGAGIVATAMPAAVMPAATVTPATSSDRASVPAVSALIRRFMVLILSSKRRETSRR
jgi:hypothetical protein